MRFNSHIRASKVSIVLLVLAVLISSPLVAGCASQANVPGAPAPESTIAPQVPTKTDLQPTGTPSPAAAPITLKVGTTRQIKSSNPVSDYWYGVLGGFLTQESLVRIDPKLGIKPGLAEKWEVSDQATVWRFYITRKAKWHDGRSVTADDVKFNLEYRLAKDPQSAWMKNVLKSVDIEGDAVVLRLSKPYSSLLVEFDTYRVLPKHVWEKVDDPLKYTGEDATLGCGPYQVDKIDLSAGAIAFKANPDYFEGKPAVDRVEFSIFRNVDAMAMALSKGEIDVTWDYSASLPYTSVPPLMKSSGIEFATEVDMGVPVALGFNVKQGPASNRLFREAVSYAVDYAKLAELVFVGYGRAPTAAFVPPSMPNHDASLRPLKQDLKKAGELLDSIGLKDVNGDGVRENAQGGKLELTVLSRTDSDVIARSAELVQGYLKAVGLACNLRALDTATWTSTKDKMEYDLVLFRTTPWGMMMHASYASGYFDSRRSGAGVLHNVDDPAYLALCDQILRTTDETENRVLQTKLQEYYATELPAIALAWADNVYPYNSKWKGWQLDIVHGGPVNRYSLFTVKPTAP
ncbi:MAG: ABC transporter substrate-binding protein [Chloroflexota bacterium]